MLSKNPILNGVLTTLFTALGAVLVVFLLSLVNKTTFAEEFDTGMIVICAVFSIASGVTGYMQAKRAGK